jgi:hypothetical protein
MVERKAFNYLGFYLISQDLRQGINFPPQDERVAPKTERRKKKEKKINPKNRKMKTT